MSQGGSEPIARFRGRYAFLSNFHACPVGLFGWVFPSSEHCFQAMKAAEPEPYWRLFVDSTLSPGMAKKLGGVIPIRADWEGVKVDFMRAILWDKFTRNAPLGQQLLATGGVLLVEGNTWGDYFWGVCGGVGENWLGRLLMETREHLHAAPCGNPASP